MSAHIGKGETIKQMVGLGFDIFKAKVLPHGRTISSRTRETIFYPVKRMLANPDEYEFLEEGGKGVFPPINKGKTMLMKYLDEINKVYKDNPKNELYVDQDMNLYEYDGKGDTITRIYYDGRFFNEDEGVLSGFKGREKLNLVKADKRSKRLLRALQRDTQRTWNQKRASEENVFWFNSKDKVDQVVKGEKNLSLDKYEDVVDAIEYENWYHNLGTKRFTKYQIQDLELQEKAIRALSNKEVRSIVSKTINKVLNGQQITLDDVYSDLIKATGLKTGKSGPLNLEGNLLDFVVPDAIQDDAQRASNRADMLAFNGPSIGKLALDRETNLAATAALGVGIDYAAKLPGAPGWIAKGLSVGADVVGGVTGHAVGAAFGTVAGAFTVGTTALGLLWLVAKKTYSCIMNNKNKITKNNKNKLTEEITNGVRKDLNKAVNDLKELKKEEIKEERDLRRVEGVEDLKESDKKLAQNVLDIAVLEKFAEGLIPEAPSLLPGNSYFQAKPYSKKVIKNLKRERDADIEDETKKLKISLDPLTAQLVEENYPLKTIIKPEKGKVEIGVLPSTAQLVEENYPLSETIIMPEKGKIDRAKIGVLPSTAQLVENNYPLNETIIMPERGKIGKAEIGTLKRKAEKIKMPKKQRKRLERDLPEEDMRAGSMADRKSIDELRKKYQSSPIALWKKANANFGNHEKNKMINESRIAYNEIMGTSFFDPALFDPNIKITTPKGPKTFDFNDLEAYLRNQEPKPMRQPRIFDPNIPKPIRKPRKNPIVEEYQRQQPIYENIYPIIDNKPEYQNIYPLL